MEASVLASAKEIESTALEAGGEERKLASEQRRILAKEEPLNLPGMKERKLFDVTQQFTCMEEKGEKAC